MKKLLPLLILPVLFINCKKEAEHCWKCNYTYSGKKPDKTGDTSLCHLTETDIKLRQDIKLDATAAGYTTWMLTNCQQQ